MVFLRTSGVFLSNFWSAKSSSAKFKFMIQDIWLVSGVLNKFFVMAELTINIFLVVFLPILTSTIFLSNNLIELLLRNRWPLTELLLLKSSNMLLLLVTNILIILMLIHPLNIMIVAMFKVVISHGLSSIYHWAGLHVFVIINRASLIVSSYNFLSWGWRLTVHVIRDTVFGHNIISIPWNRAVCSWSVVSLVLRWSSVTVSLNLSIVLLFELLSWLIGLAVLVVTLA